MDTFNNTVPASNNAALNKGPLGGRTEGALEPSGADLLGGNTAYGAQQTGYAGQTGSAGMNEVCDPPTIYNAAGAPAAVNYVHDNQRERTYEALDVNKTVVQHEIERVKPVLHQEEHKTRLHEVVHHKVEAPRDLGITEVVHHGHTDPCGNPLSGIPGATTGAYSSGAVGTGAVGTGVGSGLNTTTGTSGYTGTTGTSGYTGTTGTTGYTGTTGTGTDAAYGQTEQHQEPGGIKGMINKVVPGPGPFKA